MNRRSLFRVSIVLCFIVTLGGCSARPDVEPDSNLQTGHEESARSLLSFVDMQTYALVLSDLQSRGKALVNLQALPGWPGPAPEQYLAAS